MKTIRFGFGFGEVGGGYFRERVRIGEEVSSCMDVKERFVLGVSGLGVGRVVGWDCRVLIDFVGFVDLIFTMSCTVLGRNFIFLDLGFFVVKRGEG